MCVSKSVSGPARWRRSPMPVSVTGCTSAPDSRSRAATSSHTQPPVKGPDTSTNAVMIVSSHATVRTPGHIGRPRSPVR